MGFGVEWVGGLGKRGMWAEVGMDIRKHGG